jgi:hypothetical protein
MALVGVDTGSMNPNVHAAVAAMPSASVWRRRAC